MLTNPSRVEKCSSAQPDVTNWYPSAGRPVSQDGTQNGRGGVRLGRPVPQVRAGRQVQIHTRDRDKGTRGRKQTETGPRTDGKHHRNNRSGTSESGSSSGGTRSVVVGFLFCFVARLAVLCRFIGFSALLEEARFCDIIFHRSIAKSVYDRPEAYEPTVRTLARRTVAEGGRADGKGRSEGFPVRGN